MRGEFPCPAILPKFAALTFVPGLPHTTRFSELKASQRNSHRKRSLMRKHCEFPARMHKSKNLRELSAKWACKRIAIVPWHPFSGISLQFRGVAL